MTTLARNRRHPAARILLIALALLVTGATYTTIASVTKATAEETTASETLIEEGRRLYLEGCSSCHGLEAQGSDNGPGLIGAGAAGVSFQVGTGRMPLAAPGPQAPAKTPQYNEDEIAAMAAYVASLAPGPAIPTAEQLDFADADVAEGGELFRANCAQCHQAAGGGGALTEGKFAPSLMNASPQVIYEAMLTGPQNMPVFGDGTLTTADKQSIISFIDFLQNKNDPGGAALGRIGPVTEGLFLWIGLMVLLVAGAVWVGAKVR